NLDLDPDLDPDPDPDPDLFPPASPVLFLFVQDSSGAEGRTDVLAPGKRGWPFSSVVLSPLATLPSYWPSRGQRLTLPTKVPSDSLGRIGSLKRISDKSLFPMALGNCGHRITHQLRPINMNGRSILSVMSRLGSFSASIPQSFALSPNLHETNRRAIWLRLGAFLLPPAPFPEIHWPLTTGHWPRFRATRHAT